MSTKDIFDKLDAMIEEMKANPVTLGKALVHYREELKMDVKKAADLTGISQKRLEDIESDKVKDLLLEEALRISEVYQYPLCGFANKGSDKPFQGHWKNPKINPLPTKEETSLNSDDLDDMGDPQEF